MSDIVEAPAEPFIPPAPVVLLNGGVRLSLTMIDVPKRLRNVRQPHVDFFKAAIADQGFLGAITVRPGAVDGRYELVAGAHRLEAMRQLGREEMPVDIQDMTDDEAQLWEINENLVRHELNAKDRAFFLLTAKRLRQRIDEFSRRGGDRRSTKVQTLQFDPTPFPQSFSAEMADKLGIGPRTVLADIAFAERLAPEVLDLLDGTKIVDNRSALIALSQKTHAQQRTIVTEMVERGAKTIAQAAVAAGFEEPVTEDPQKTYLGQLERAWDLANPVTRLAFLDLIDAAFIDAYRKHNPGATAQAGASTGSSTAKSSEPPSTPPSRGGRRSAKGVR